MSLFALLLIVLILGALVTTPVWPHSREWGYRPTGVLWLLVIVVSLFFLFDGFGHSLRLR